jgi:heat shock protein HtpX
MGALTGLLVGLGYVVGGSGLALIALIFAGVMNFFSYWFSDKLALRMAGAHEVSEAEAPGLHALVEDVAARAGVPKPRVYIVENESPMPSRPAGTRDTPSWQSRPASCTS